MNQKNTMITHKKLINLISNTYEKSLGGICHGLTLKWLEACLLHDEAQFTKRLKNIASSSLEKVRHIKTKVKRHETLSEDEISYLEILAFFDHILLYQDPDDYQVIFHKNYSQDSIEQISTIAGSDAIVKQGGIIRYC